MHPPETQEQRPPGALDELAADPASRRRFLKAAGGTGAAGALAALIAACGGSKQPKPTPGGSDPNTAAGTGTDRYGNGDRGVAGYLVTVEYVEADFWREAAGSGKLSGQAAELARRFGEHEQQHIATLERGIRRFGAKVPARPKANFPLDSREAILRFARDLQSLSAGAYLAQVNRILDKELLADVVSIHSVEGRHAAALATLLGESPTAQGPFAKPAATSDVLNQLHALTAPG